MTWGDFDCEPSKELSPAQQRNERLAAYCFGAFVLVIAAITIVIAVRSQ